MIEAGRFWRHFVPRWVQCGLLGLAVSAASLTPGFAATNTVNVGDDFFSPRNLTNNLNDTVVWNWIGVLGHSSTATGLWDSGIFGTGHVFSRQFTCSGNFPYFCIPHQFIGMVGSISVTGPANVPPTITLTSPTNGVVFNAPAKFTLTATASDSDDSISQVQFFKGATSVGIVRTNISPYSVSVSNLAAGAYLFSAVATDACGGKATNSINLIVNDLPVVSITNPTNGATFAAPLTNTIQVTATDGDGVRRVDFFAGQTPLGTATNPPFSLLVTNFPVGTNTLTAMATDNLGGSASSAGVTIVVVTSVPIVLSSPRRLTATNFQFSYTANPGLTYVVERSSTLTNWTQLDTNTAASGSVTFTDPQAVGTPNFYRVRRLPNP
jgi:plastocyanin